MTSDRGLTTTRYSRGDAGRVRERLVEVYAEVYEVQAAADPFFSVARFRDRLAGHSAHPGWACVVGEIEGEVVGYAYGRPDGETEWGQKRSAATVTVPWTT